MKSARMLLSMSLVAIGCGDQSLNPQGPVSTTREGAYDTPTSPPSADRLLIKDQTVKQWDVTHAWQRYGFIPEEYQFGLGPFAIPPIMDPQMLAPGDPGYPEDSAGFVTMGVFLNGSARAYPIRTMS
ncbi:MAG: hypothetical protein FJY95_04935 [Candidatus Handelsmanbacteria bacterium]|nr:hypothetical protein [Candidatus Handelsmanbacteria bacterium]